MKLHTLPNNWSCLPTAFAMVIDTTPAIMIKHLGHDGSEIWWPDNPEPYNRRGFHIQEIIHVCWMLGHSPTLFEPRPTAGSPFCFKQRDVTLRSGLFEGVLKSNNGVLVGKINGKHHAVAWNSVDQLVYDPNGTQYCLDWFSIREFYSVR